MDVRHGSTTGKIGLGCKLRKGMLVARAVVVEIMVVVGTVGVAMEAMVEVAVLAVRMVVRVWQAM